MARGKKKESALTPEEKLAQALVPTEEQPYKVPENWCWVKIGTVSDVYTGNSINERTKAERYTGQTQGRIFIATKDVGFDNSINYDTNVRITDYENFRIAPANTALLCIEGGSAGRKIGFTIRDVCFGNKLCAFRTNKIHSKYIFFFLQSQCFLDGFEAKKHGLIGGVSVRDIGDVSIVLPPLAEQQRIVDRIEYLFAKLDEAREKAQSVLDSFEARKAAILHKAFTGELTAKWRAEQGLEMNSWKNIPVNQLCKPRAGYAFDSKKFTDSGYQVIRMGNLYGGVLDLLRNPVFISHDDLDEATLKRSLINDGDILITLTGTKYKRDYGYAVVVKNAGNLLVNQRILCLTPYSSVVTNYILYYFQSDLFRDIFFSNETGGVNQGNVSSRFVESIELAVPSYSEQIELVRILDSLFAKEQQAKEAAEAVLEKIDLLKKSILARAFRGELGTNDPTEASALELLKEIL